MSVPPFTTPSGGPRRRRRWLLVALLALAAVAVGAALTLGGGSKGRRALARSRAGAGAGAAASATTATSAPALSPTGLPLGHPALTLHGLGSTAQDPIQLRFHYPPREGLLFDLTTGRVLWQRNALKRVPIASLTKMMTALLVVKAAPPDAPVPITREAVDADGSKVGLLPRGKRVRLETLLYGLLLPSGNDAAVALAQYVAGSVHAFVARMNEQAARLGLGCTRFSSPSGYYDQDNFSCAADLAVLAHDDLAQPRVERVTRTYSAILPFPIKGGKLYLYNNNPLLVYGYPGTTGLKTGYTEAAGRCVVGTAERDGVRLGVVILHSTEPGIQARKLLDRGFRDVYHLPRVVAPAMPAGA